MKTLTPEDVAALRASASDQSKFMLLCWSFQDEILATLEEHFAEGTTEPMTEQQQYRES